MNRIDLADVENIVTDDDALTKLVKSFINDNTGFFAFTLPVGTSDVTRQTFDDFINKVNFEFERISRDTKILPTTIREPIVEPIVVEEVITEQTAETIKRKK